MVGAREKGTSVIGFLGHTSRTESDSARLILVLECSFEMQLTYTIQDVRGAGIGLDSCNVSHRRSWQCVLFILSVWPIEVFFEIRRKCFHEVQLSSNPMLLFLCLTCFPEPSGNHTTEDTFLRCFLAWAH